MNELEIKARFLELVRSASKPRRKPVVTTEFSIANGNTRADLAILAEEFVGVEIKSGRDSLARLGKQVADYRVSFDRVVLVLDGKHLVKYLGLDFEFCDVWTFDEENRLRQFSTGTHRRADDENLFGLLAHTEKESAFRNPEFAGLTKRESFELAFTKRYISTSKRFWKKVASRKISTDDVRSLSRFHDIRAQSKELENQRRSAIENWITAQEDFTRA